MGPDDAAAGGDDACWLHLVCDGCGGAVDDPAHRCPGEPSADPVVRQAASTASGRSDVAAGEERRIAQVE